MASTVLTRTPSGTGNQKKWTYSIWFKRVRDNEESALFCVGDNPSNNMCMLRFDPDVLNFYSNNSNAGRFSTQMKFRDTNGWYHVVLAYDSANATSDDRVKFYVNGERIPSSDWTSVSTVAQDTDSKVNSTLKIHIGERPDSNAHFEGLMSHIHFCDGYAYAASDFGSTDSTTGEWKINTTPNVQYGTNGFWILKDGNSVTDQSPNSNNFAVEAGTLTKSEDNPSNVFATLNALDNYYANSTFYNGSTNVVFNNSNECFNYSTLGMSTGKFYFEGKQISRGNLSNERNYFGVTYSPPDASSDWLGNNNYSWGYRGDGKVYNSGQLQATYSSFTNGDIIGVALDVTNSKLYFSKNGVWQNSADPANGTNGLSVNAGKTYFFAIGETTGASGVESATNFGNGYFQTTAVSSNSGNGYSATGSLGIFQYQPPTGYTALCTKGLNL